MQIRCRRIETRLDPQWAADLQALGQVFPLDDFVGATGNGGQRLLKLAHVFSFSSGEKWAAADNVTVPSTLIVC
jgi:hypothetical protein